MPNSHRDLLEQKQSFFVILKNSAKLYLQHYSESLNTEPRLSTKTGLNMWLVVNSIYCIDFMFTTTSSTPIEALYDYDPANRMAMTHTTGIPSHQVICWPIYLSI